MRAREQRRAQLLDAAMKAVIRFGYRKTTVDDIARQAGVTRATIYNYFPGKDQIFTALVEREIKTLRCAIWKEVDPMDPPQRRLECFVRARYRQLRRLKELYSVVLDVGRDLMLMVPGLLQDFERQQQEFLADLLREGVESKIFSPTDVDLLAAALLAALRGMDEAFMFEDREMLARGAEILVSTLVKGLRVPT